MSDAIDKLIDAEHSGLHPAIRAPMRNLMQKHADNEIKRFLDHMASPTSNTTWCFSMDLGGATESGFAWARYDDFNHVADDSAEIEVVEGKDIASLLKYTRFDQGFPVEHWWEVVGELS